MHESVSPSPTICHSFARMDAFVAFLQCSCAPLEDPHRSQTCRHDKAAAFITSKITHENWKSLSARGDAAEAKKLACKTWILFASHLVEV
jgi:hypothetical protein